MLLLTTASFRAAATPEPAGPSAGPQAVSADWILARLARPVPTRTAFVELRESRLLKEPLRLSGEYRRPENDVLVREVRVPYAETTTLRAGEATIERAGRAPRTFSLARAPELAGVQASFGALLGGDRSALDQDYAITADGSRGRWTLRLVPRQPALARQLRDITLYGRGAELRCIETRLGDASGPQRTLLAGAATSAAQLTDGAALAGLCHGADTATR
jgi:hypothetical protein